jgi:hypothetical protein
MIWRSVLASISTIASTVCGSKPASADLRLKLGLRH